MFIIVDIAPFVTCMCLHFALQPNDLFPKIVQFLISWIHLPIFFLKIIYIISLIAWNLIQLRGFFKMSTYTMHDT
jgi:hypothetical protein